jgi:cytoskeletal protein RodZ
MKSIKNKQDGFGVVEALLLVIALTLVVFVVFYVVNAQKDSNNDSSNAKPATSVSPQTKSPDTSSQATPATTASDNDQITQAVKDYTIPGDTSGVTQKNANVKITEIKGENARGTFDLNEPGSGASFIAKKINGKWQVVFEGQEAAGKDVGTKYNLPAGWYDASY